jgi:CDP-4-dehydro-6-deoxyglucose reductase
MFGFFKKNKGPFNATISPLGKTISVKGGSSENLLKVALENGINWPYNCRVGSCGSCKCKLVSGQIKPLNDFSYVLTGEELDQGYILACQTMLRSDIEVEVPLEANGVELAKSRRIEGRISRVEKLTHDILDVGIELEAALTDYLPGQYADVTIPGVIDKARSYSFSRSPSHEKPNNVSFFIRRVPNGSLTEWLHTGDRRGDRVLLEGPHGSFYLREPSGSILLVAGGSGLAPIRALMQQFIDEGRKGKVTLIFGARTRNDLYCLDEIEEYSKQLNGQFSFLPVLSQETAADGWDGATGHCPNAIAEGMLEASDGQAYLCGPPVMVDAAVSRLKALGIGEQRIFFDKFLDASSMPSGRA